MRKTLPLFLVLAAALFALAASHLHAQQPATPYPFLMSAEQIQAFVAAWNSHSDYVPGQTLVKFRDGAAPSDQSRALSAVRRGTAGASTRWIGDVLMISTPDNPDAPGIAATLAQQPEVEWAQPNYLRHRRARPNDPNYSLQWNMDLLEMPAAWDINKGASSNVTVAVVDTGVTTTTTTLTFPLWTGQQFENVAVPFRISPDITASRIKAGRDFVFWNGPVLDMDGHGTHVASIILEDTNNSVGTAGIAYQASLLPLKVCIGYWELQILKSGSGQPGFVDQNNAGDCPDDAIAQAIRYAADSGAQVINVSLSGPDPAPLLRDAVSYAVSHGSFVAMAVGNEFQDGNPVEYPAAYAAQISGAMAVGAVGRSSKRAPYSNTGSHLEIVAPGGDFDDGGLNGMVTAVAPNFLDFDPSTSPRPRFDRYSLVSVEGTSAAAPHIVGVAALLSSQGIATPSAIESAIERTATDLGQAGRDNEFGFGLVNARRALRGMGLVK